MLHIETHLPFLPVSGSRLKIQENQAVTRFFGPGMEVDYKNIE
jgi:hypothetical protein